MTVPPLPTPLLLQQVDAQGGAVVTKSGTSADALPWLLAGAILAAWIGTALVRRRSARALEAALDSEAVSEGAGREYPLLDRLASAAFRRVRSERERQTRLADRVGEIERVLRATPIAVIALDHLQRVVSANPAAERLLSFDERAARGRLLQESVRQHGLNRAIQSALASEGRFTGELHLDSEDSLEVQVSCEPLHQDGAPSGLVVSLVDVTRMRRLESMRSEFAANVSHELRTPITNIKGYVETLLQIDDAEPVQTRRFLEIVHRNTVRLSGIVEDILTLAFLEEPEARQSLAKDPIAVNEIVTQVVSDLGSAAALREMTLEVDCDPALTILGNRSLLEQALANLVSNAIKYSSERTEVRISAGFDEGTEARSQAHAGSGNLIRIAVSDSGPGIASKHLPRIFERFYRVDKARSRTQGGTGLGLAIVKHIASIHGGRVEAESTVGVGSRFSLLLPSAAVAETPRPSAEIRAV
ncbi:MAG: ATP-binding protein [Planctomycetaceae bacterium]|jgi:two-component system phosphate regulon sensor histidine kinase PhoR|nr:ATP-binding protein [Planctomycetaceae bacterium]